MTLAHFQTYDGATLPLRTWLPADVETKGVLLALHGFGDHAGAWETFGPALAAQGYAVYAFDQRGFGQSTDRGRWPGADVLIADTRAAVRAVSGANPDQPLYLAGESMGGALVIAALTGADAPTEPVAGVVLMAPALWARETMAWPLRFVMWAARKMLPNIHLTGRGIERYPTNNVPLQYRLAHDPLWVHAPTIESLAGLTDVMDIAYARFAELKPPILMLYGLNDEMVPAGPVRTVAGGMDITDTRNRLAVYPEGWHLLTRDIEGPVVIGDVVSWLDRMDAPLPSGADQNASAFLDRTLRSSMERKERESPTKAWERLSEPERTRLKREQDALQGQTASGSL